MTAQNSEEAIKEKDLGNEAYKKRDFDTAHSHYGKAIELDPNNIVFYSNKAAVFFEEAKYEECIEICKKGIDVGRENKADFKQIAKAMARIGNSFLKLEKEEEAATWLDKSLSEHREPTVVKKRQELEKVLKEKQRMAYIDPDIAQQEKGKGNEFFKKGSYPEALTCYNEAIKRDPDNAVLYSNRAACYTKLMEFNLALADCEKCVEKDPKFVKGHIRKAAALMALRRYSAAAKACDDALAIDPNNQEAMNMRRDCWSRTANDNNEEDVKKRAMQDPEVQQILSDPAMRAILEQMTRDPGALMEHMKNPEIARKIEKLIDIGIIQTRTAGGPKD